ncbi:hypothetical protein B9Z55_017447 [Caenorhabditis nigoni]|uniref:Acyl_transf_3 domain-containing protein n=1 Tax=Caenorhabditis nigoni TaxID=1611254 RepID=A0A2G5T9L0_9PELO|nr:hypothetical protein B9Z55_017447 [Caenorhabditis nigoni]
MTTSKRNDLQGIRGLAILSVLGFHFYPKLFSNGYLGVDQFFVLSGFLMCMLLTRSQKLPIFSIVFEFYRRRLRRILPLYFLFIFCTILALYTVFPDTAIVQNRDSAGKALLFISNRPHTQDEQYFEKLSLALDLFTHTWSLSVEIQFYLIAPIIFLIGHQFKKFTKYIIYAVIALCSFAFYSFSSPLTSFNSVFARIWQFLIGMLTYFMLNHTVKLSKLSPGVDQKGEDRERLLEENTEDPEPKITKSGPSTVSLYVKYLILILTIMVMGFPEILDSTWSRPFITTLTGLVILIEAENYILNSRILIYFGDISYALYLIHWPIYAYFKLVYKEKQWILPGACLLSIVLAVLVRETYEKWYLKQSNAIVFSLILPLFCLSAVMIHKDEILKQMEKTEVVPMSPERKFPRLDGVTMNMTLDDAERLNTYWNQHDHMAAELQEPGCIKRRGDRWWCDFKENGTEFKIALLGNSYAKNHHKMIIQECKHRAKMISLQHETGCEPLAAPRKPVDNGGMSIAWARECKDKLREFVEFVNETQPDYAFILTRWYAVGEPYEIDESHLGNDTIYLEMRSQLAKLLPNIRKKLFILDSFPRANMENLKNIVKEMKTGKKTMEEINRSLYDPTGFEQGRRRHAELMKECGSKCELIDYVDAFWNKTMDAFQYFDTRGFSYFTTPLHLSAHGIEYVRPIFTKICDSL